MRNYTVMIINRRTAEVVYNKRFWFKASGMKVWQSSDDEYAYYLCNKRLAIYAYEGETFVRRFSG